MGDDVLYAIRVEKEGKFLGYVTEMGLVYTTPTLSKAHFYRAKNFADIRSKRINKYRSNEDIKSEVIEVKLVPRKDDE
jgi:hypothetical protein